MSLKHKHLITKNLPLMGQDIDTKRGEIKEYFLKTYNLFEKIFEVFTDDSVFYERPELLRHQLIFYFGHTAVFYINKLIVGKYIHHRINPEFESMFAIGVDEMSWDDLNSAHYDWPSVDAVREYRERVKHVVLDYIDRAHLTLPITWESPLWVILMGIEHERIHIETSLVLHRQLPISKVKLHEDFIACSSNAPTPQNELLKVKGGVVKLGKRDDGDYYGWDNEYGFFEEEIADFEAGKFLVSNGEYLDFVNDNGYYEPKFWSQEGQGWLEYTKVEHPTFWIKNGNKYKFRTLTDIRELPLNWPVEVNYLEAEAFCNWKSKKTGDIITLPTEAMYQRVREVCEIGNEVDVKANINFEQFSSSTPVDYNFHEGFYDVVGNVWQWTRTPIDGFEGFRVHPLYDDFSVPTFDTRHNIIKGGSWASSGNEVLRDSRYAFRRHFYQFAGFRYVRVKELIDEESLYYEKDEIVSQYCEFHYGDEHLGVKNFAKAVADLGKKYAPKGAKSALDIGCSVGRTSFELATHFERVVGIDFSARFINVADELKTNGVIRYEKKIEGDIKELKEVRVEQLGLDVIDMSRVEFWQGDACNLKAHFNSYDVVIAANLIDRLYDPKLFLEDIKWRINSGGVFIIGSPFTWSEEYVQRSKWLGGKVEDGRAIYSEHELMRILKEDFILVDEPFEVEFVIQEHIRKFQHTKSLFSVWKKR